MSNKLNIKMTLKVIILMIYTVSPRSILKINMYSDKDNVVIMSRTQLIGTYKRNLTLRINKILYSHGLAYSNFKAADILILAVCLVDSYYSLIKNGPRELTICERFFNICNQLPVELQTIICNRACGYTKNIIEGYIVDFLYEDVLLDKIFSNERIAIMIDENYDLSLDKLDRELCVLKLIMEFLRKNVFSSYLYY